MDDRNAARQIAAIFGRSCREPGNDPGLDPALDSAAEVVARIRAEARAELAKKIVEWPEANCTSPWMAESNAYYEIIDYCTAILADEPKEREGREGLIYKSDVDDRGEG